MVLPLNAVELPFPSLTESGISQVIYHDLIFDGVVLYLELSGEFKASGK